MKFLSTHGPRAARRLLIAAACTGTACADPPAGLACHFDFNQAPAENAFLDRSPNKTRAVLAGAQWNPNGKTGAAIDCAPARRGASVQTEPAFGLEKFTFSLWFQARSAPAQHQTLLRCGGFHLFLSGDPKDRGKVVAQLDGLPPCLSDTALPPGGWHHTAVSYDGSSLRLYFDGVAQKQTVDGKTTRPAAATILLGTSAIEAASSPAPSFDGLLDEFMAFRRDLSADEIRALVNSIDPKAIAQKFTKSQVAGQIRMLEQLYEEGLLTDTFYRRKVLELQALTSE